MAIEKFTSKVGVAKNMQDALSKSTPRENVLNIKISRHTLVFRYLWNVLAKFHDNPLNYIPYKFAQSGSIPPKIKCETSACKGS